MLVLTKNAALLVSSDAKAWTVLQSAHQNAAYGKVYVRMRLSRQEFEAV